MGKKSSIHVVPNPKGGWDRKQSGETQGHHRTQANATKAGRSDAQRQGTELVIHGRDGKIRDKNSYGNDSHPPKG